jgi:6,7-dimethyl-8-ribityllumazine synthase
MRVIEPLKPLVAALRGKSVAVVGARFNDEIADRLVHGCVARIRDRGVPEDAIDVLRVAGSFEVPPAAMKLALTERYAAIVCLGVLIRGETPHFDYIAQACSQGIARVALETGVPCAFGILTCETEEQALARTGGPLGHKGAEAADAALDMVGLFAAIDGAGASGNTP